MFGGDRDLDTICAISTPPGVGGLHVIRVSGPHALFYCSKIATFLPSKPESHRLYFGTLRWGSDGHESIDEVLVSYFKEGRSYTGEETLEISCHGSAFIAGQIIRALTEAGSRLADRGEFTYRAFMNGKMDLVQAESVLSLIESESKKANEIALRQLKGGLSSQLKKIESEVLALLARLEISIDFTTEDVEIINNEDIQARLSKITPPIERLLGTFRVGSKLQSGFEVVLIGEPNVGKSSLLNCVLGENRAIVTEVPGTTRDLIQDQVMIKGVKVTITDSAGIRETQDLVEKIGVHRTKEAIERADLVLVVFDSSQPHLDHLLVDLPENLSKCLFVANKNDLIDELARKDIWNEVYSLTKKRTNQELELHQFVSEKCISVSSLSRESQQLVLGLIERNLETGSFGDEAIVSQARHFENLSQAMECFVRAGELAIKKASPEFLALEVKEGLVRIQETLGERFDDQVLDRVFREFCIGK